MLNITIVSVSTVQPSLNQEFLCIEIFFFKIFVHFKWKTAKQRPILYENWCLKANLNDEKAFVDQWLLYDILWGLKALCEIFVFNMIPTDFCNILEYRFFLDAIQNQYIGIGFPFFFVKSWPVRSTYVLNFVLNKLE